MDKLVSIAIPVYKGRFLADAITSVLRQSYKNIEVIIVNDKSPDNIIDIVESFDDDRIHFYENATNVGSVDPAINWNKCIEYSNGDFFALLCDDDVYKETFVEEMLAMANKFPLCNVFRARAEFVDTDGLTTDLYPSSPLWESMEDYMWHVLNGFRRQTISEFLYRTDCLKKLNGFVNLPQAWVADYVSVFKLSKEGGIASSSKILVSFRMSGQNISSQLDSKVLLKLEANKKAYDITKDAISITVETWKHLLSDSVEIWKRRLDRDTICWSHSVDLYRIIKHKRKYGYSYITIIKAVVLRMLIKWYS